VTSQPRAVDPFDLPEWLGVDEVTWSPDTGIRSGHLVSGTLAGVDGTLPCDLLAVDQAYPRPVADEQTRVLTHQAWHHGQLHLVEYAGRLTLVVPGRDFAADRVLDAIGRFARAVGAPERRYAVHLRLGGGR
jgi:hypothetical protein